jgi:putative transposase
MADQQGGKYRKLTHTVYQCNYHVVWVPKYRYRVLEGPIKEAVEHDTRVANGRRWR